MLQLRCTVRNCHKLLKLHGKSLKCSEGHNFDQAKGGYWNLTQPQDKKSSNPGDTDEAVLSRHRWLQRGYAQGLIESLREWCDVEEDAAIIDLGCGEGSFGPALFHEHENGYCGIDLSRRAIKLAARGWREATWVLANADRGLPFRDNSIQVTVSLFGRRPVHEIHRVLASKGICIVAIPGEEDLIELREKVQKTGQRRSRWQGVVDEMTDAGLQLVKHKLWTEQHRLDNEEIADALAMTYRAIRQSEQMKLSGVEPMTVTLSADLMLFKKS